MPAVSNTPVPPRMEHKDYPLEELRVGQSFFIRLRSPSRDQVAKVRAAVFYWLRMHPEFKRRYRVIAEPSGIRVGRIA